MEIQPSLVLLQKTLLNIEGLGRQLYPELNLWDTAQPYLEEWVAQRYSPQAVVKRLQQQAPSLIEQLPHLTDAVIQRLQQPVGTGIDRQAPPQKSSSPRSRPLRYAGGLLAIGGGVVLALPGGASWLGQIPLASWVLLGLGATLVVFSRK